MASFTGMDIAEVRQLSATLKSKAEEIRNIQNQLTNQLQSAQWVGPDRERFLGDWQSQHCAALNSVIQGLEGASQTANRNAQEQESASNS